ncbi:hypothetical protein ARALYDRAFT_892218 [Arabidopsis lyrata subsp. lyrata]|uniref:Malectin-like domain-containing protein n=1 Tax=Arabidopsis lyrata subsp. lyrata TaxID=81972 RepID=D7KIP8_ARALL|nr:hypothetical protein ARALYDRAFT_892218 [Arabidopsis lyrata subsp. lyrata]
MNTTYWTRQGSLQTFIRADVGATVNQYRYGIDVFDRVWTRYNFRNCSRISTNHTVNVNNDYQPPEIAMVTASFPTDPDAPMNISLFAVEPTLQLFMVMHFAEIQELNSSDVREFNIMYNGKHIYGPIRPLNFTTSSVFTSTEVVADESRQYTFSLQRTENSTLPPLLNGMEIFWVNLLPQQETDRKQGWNLSASGLTGEILEFISDLTSLEVLDLSNNSMTGSVPEFLADMETLKLINLSGNELNGSIPATLLDKARRGSISISIEGNVGLCSSTLCPTTEKKKKNTVIAPVAASLVLFFLIGAGIVTFLILKRKKSAKLGLHSRTHHGFEPPVIAVRAQRLVCFLEACSRHVNTAVANASPRTAGTILELPPQVPLAQPTLVLVWFITAY